MDQQGILALFDREQRIDIDYPETRKEIFPNIVRVVRAMPGMSFISYSRLDDSSADAAIQSQIDYFRQNGMHFSWKVYGHDTPADLKQRLVNHGLSTDPDDSASIMVLDLQSAPPSLLQPVTADIRPIKHREALKDVVQIMEQVWGGNFEWMYNRMGHHLEIPGYLSVYVAYSTGQPVSAAWTYYSPDSQFASLWGGSTLPEARGQGFYTQILSKRVQEAIQRGRRYLYIDAMPTSRPIVEKHGFQFLTSTDDFEWDENKSG